MKRFFIIGAIFGFGAAAIIVPAFLRSQKDSKISVTTEEAPEKYPLLAKRIFVDNPNDIIIDFTKLRNQLKGYAVEGNVRYGIYFEYLPTGVYIGVNERETFYRASLIKVPIVMKAYKLKEEGKIRKDEILPITRDDIDRGYGSLGNEGRSEIAFTEAIKLILTKSDNTAFKVVNRRVNKEIEEQGDEVEKAIIDVFDYLDIPRDESGETEALTARNYSSIMKSLFFSAYLNYENSNEILSILGESEFTDWMPEPIPDDIIVAHKTGIFDIEESIYSVHSDCGIVYYPNRPYLQCIMVNSADPKTSLKIIREISKMIYDYMDSISGQ
ncbi:hypothetical protein A2686_01205 [Candidatus Woesebacteria bacterium RIFCSPHIGHO2_01_FULL_38_10]|uniref:Beta-lactamase class A catalytic domain-containing protein n=1 Tax=Candidatus Woesebacteria bacterium RIFCSPLOWO2_01_FULL_39_10b TaxID=1802517 RepID=A0A1F8B5F1_9BACT|nr:MAG: hypothetical protein A2686_01205 [Candidatus Woesebacteria bacterium RIFCSPHIGHO2_01_FULL_38_10]OGM59241.1 MAG: hypothetical protein A2892_05190 [Candidatus Woesebacteria bacterium RIFCSPLOWO2_01_FULL_39_10b]